MANDINWGQGAINNNIGWGQGAKNNSIGWGSSQFTSPAGETEIYGLRQDAATTAFLSATAITDATITSAIDTLVVDLKAYGIWSKMKAIYPFVGGTATTHKFNLVNSADTDGAFRLSFNGGWTHSNNGALPNGTNGYADTFVTPSTNLSQNNTHASIYSRTNNTSLINRIEIGSSNGTIDFQQSIRWDGSLGNLSRLNNAFGVNGYLPTKTSGYYITSRTASNITKKYEDNVLKETNTETSSSPNGVNITIGGRNTSGTVMFYDAKQYAFATIGDGLTDEDSANLYYSVQKFQTTLGRQVGTPIYSSNATDVNARLFLGATNIQDATITSAVDTLVQGLKTDGIWTKLKAVYPFVGGTATTHKFNLANALDEDTSFRLSFSGGITHSSNGIQGNGVNGFANTFVSPLTNLSQNSVSVNLYSRTNVIGGADFGSLNLLGYLNFSNRVYTKINQTTSFSISTNTTASTGLFSFIRNSGTEESIYKNGSLLDTFTKISVVPTSSSMYLLAYNPGEFSNKQFSFASIGNGLTDTEASNLYTRVQAFQTSLSRNI